MRRALLALMLFSAVSCADRSPDRVVQVRVGSLAVDTSSNSPVVILEELEGERQLPIWIGYPEASSIAAELQQEKPLRPNTHDLAKRLVDQLDGAVERVVVTDLSHGVFYAIIFLHSEGRELRVDARPSDAIALALRTGAPVFVRETVFELADSPLEEEGREIDAPERTPWDRQVPTRSI